MKAVDEALHLSQVFGIQATDPALISVLAVFSCLWQLVDASLDDEALLEFVPDKSSRWLIHDMEIDEPDRFIDATVGNQEGMLKTNTVMAMEFIVTSLQSRVISQILYLVRQNM